MRHLILLIALFAVPCFGTAKMSTLADVTVATAGTRVQASATSLFCTKVTVQALTGNTGNVFVGDSLVSATRGLGLAPGEKYEITGKDARLTSGQEYVDLSDVWFDSATNANKLKIIYVNTK